jgi:predicted component of type VI protein secretion system
MITLRLFREDDLQRQLDAYILGDGEVTIGRDAAAIWVIEDPDRRLSRLHCTVSARGGHVRVRDTSANGVFRGGSGQRLEHGLDTDIAHNEALHVGPYVIVVDASRRSASLDMDTAGSQLDVAPMADPLARSGANAIPDQWLDPGPAPGNQPERSTTGRDFLTLEAFCEGAGLDPSFFASEDPLELIRRVGEIYRQVMLGLGDLMSERASLKSHYSMDRTTISAADNNPLKWAPTQRLAIDLLCERNGGFLSGAEAVKESFEDLKGHSLCLMAGSRSAVSSVLEHLDPASIEADVKANAPLFMERSEASWRKLKALHMEVSTSPFDNAQSRISEAFKRGYERQARDLEEEA